jgi:transcriptional regulator with XRE-family HTH domain
MTRKAAGKGKNGRATPVVDIFARRMREWRASAQLPLKHVARDLGVSISIISEWEHGHRFPSVRHLEAVARYLKMPVCCLLYPGQGTCPRA